MLQKQSRISDSAIEDALNEADVSDPDGSLASLTQTIQSRVRIVGGAYPFRRDGMGFVRRGSWSAYLPYSFMLFASLNQHYEELRYKGGTANKPSELFEHLTLMSLEKYFGCSVLRLGAPRRNPMPANFPDALDYTVGQLGEAIGQRDLEDQKSGDDGVDVVGWLAFGDARASQAIILAQCSIGNDWKDKRNSIDLDMWKRHIDWHSAPLRGFAIPFHMEAGGPWRETATRAGIVFDRLRIARLIATEKLALKFSGELKAWCTARGKAISKLAIDG